MTRFHLNPTKTARIRLTVLTVLVVLGVAGAMGVSLAKPKSVSVTAAPASQSFTQGSASTVSFTFTVANANGPTTLQVAGVPAGVGTTWTAPAGSPGQQNKCTGDCIVLPANATTATLALRLPYDLAAGTHTLSVSATTPNNGSSAQTVTLVSAEAPDFTITGNAAGPLGLDTAAQPINVTITNPYDHELTVSDLVATPSSTDKPGCDASDFVVNQVPSGTTYSVPANSTLTVTSPKPTIRWPNDPNRAQNACIDATVTFDYSAEGTA